MIHKIAQTASLASAILALAACGGSSGSGDTTNAAAPAGGTDTVSVRSIAGAGKVLVDANGDTLYVNDQDMPGAIACTASCASEWPPLTLSGTAEPTAGDGVSGTLGVVMRPDGGRQVVWNEKPLYTFVEDGGPGKVTGDGATDSFGGTDFSWHVAGKPSASPGGSGSGGGGYGY